VPWIVWRVPVSAKVCAETGTPIASRIAGHRSLAEMGTVYVARRTAFGLMDRRVQTVHVSGMMRIPRARR